MMNPASPRAAQLSQQEHESNLQIHEDDNYSRSWKPRIRLVPCSDLFKGDRKDYLKIGVPLYQASIRCDWKAAKAIIDQKPELLSYSITENDETLLHVAAASVSSSKHTARFVKNLVDMMPDEAQDLQLQNKNYKTALYLAAEAGNIKTVMIMVEKNRQLTSFPRDPLHLPLFGAALFGNYQVVKYLYEYSEDLSDDGGWDDMSRSWLLEKCVEGDMFDVALKIVKRYSRLGSGVVLLNLARKPNAFSRTKPSVIKRSITSVLVSIGLMMGSYRKESEALELLEVLWKDIAQRPKNIIDGILRGPLDSLVNASPLQKFIYEHIQNLSLQTRKIKRDLTDHKAPKLRELIDDHLVNIEIETKRCSFRNGDPALELQNRMSNHVESIRLQLKNMFNEASGIRDEERETSLHKLITKHIKKVLDLSGFNKKQYSSRILFVAAEKGNTAFLVELIRRYPDLIWKLDDNKQSIFHIAVKHRHEGTYNLLYEIGSMKDLVTPLKDADDNNMLHLAGKRVMKEWLADVSGPALQMQRELLWFKEVRNTIPPSFRERKNKDGLTPHELFSKEHEELVKEGEKWMKETASQCMVVAALIATIVFAAAFTIPGGYNQYNGIPIFSKKPIFIAFVVADAMSLFLSSTSILTFLSILTSRYAEHDFLESLPKKLMLGISTLFLSITAMMITFSVSFFILYHKEMKWIPILISMFALVPVLFYVVLQYHVLADVIRSTYGSRYLFKPGKQVLYYVNPTI